MGLSCNLWIFNRQKKTTAAEVPWAPHSIPTTGTAVLPQGTQSVRLLVLVLQLVLSSGTAIGTGIAPTACTYYMALLFYTWAEVQCSFLMYTTVISIIFNLRSISLAFAKQCQQMHSQLLCKAPTYHQQSEIRRCMLTRPRLRQGISWFGHHLTTSVPRSGQMH